MKSTCTILILLASLTFTGCSSTKKPVLYPNQHLNIVGQQQANADIDDCMRAAEAGGANSGKSEELAKRTAKAGAVGGAGAATAALVSGAFDSSEPTQVYIRFVEICLREKGYQPIGWR
jgi:hypothetical protein